MTEAIKLEVVTAASEPVEIDDFIPHAKLDFSSDEIPTIESYLATARRYVENTTGLQLMPATYRLWLDRLCLPIELPKPPLQSVTSIYYFDSNGVDTLLSSSVYTVDKISQPGQICLAYNQSIPGYRVTTNSIKIEYVAGYANKASIPKEWITAIMQYATGLYEERAPTGEDLKEIPFHLASILWTRRAKVAI